jgi:hypothetical protein
MTNLTSLLQEKALHPQKRMPGLARRRMEQAGLPSNLEGPARNTKSMLIRERSTQVPIRKAEMGSRVATMGLFPVVLLGLAMLCYGKGFGQCANNNTAIAGGAITPSCPGTTNVPCVRGGQYALVSVEVGNQYVFSVCGATFDTQLTLYNNSGGGSLGYNDDFCGTASQITWNASFTGQLRVLVDRYNCASNTTCAPLVITCGPTPPSAQEDCIGAVTICDDASFSGNTNNTGNVVDLNSSNRGCLDPEQQGTWYVFAPSQSGTLGFSINVGGSSVYDWAIWGPYVAGTNLSTICPPSSPPIRCEASSNGGTMASTGSYTKGMGHATFSTPQHAAATGCATCSNPPSSATSCNTLTLPQRCGWVPGINVQVGEMYLMYIDNWYRTGLAFTLDFASGAGAASLACTILPVELFDLKADPRKDEVDVTWSTASERNVAFHEVQRSADGQHFVPIGRVDAIGYSQQRVDYAYVDQDPLNGANYYRLRSVDSDGAFELSNAVPVHFSRNALGRVELFPNPASSHINVRYAWPDTGPGDWRMVDASGRLVAKGIHPGVAGLQPFEIALTGLESGSYALHMIHPDGSLLGVGRFVVQ